MAPNRTIHDITPATVHEACRVTARAFADDPVLRWVRPRRSESVDARIFRGMYDALHGAAGTAHLIRENGDAVGAAFWDPPGYQPPAGRQLRSLPRLAAVGFGLRRGIRLVRALEARVPAQPHWYLATIGATVPGRGIGSALLSHGLEQVPGPAYLESSNRANIPLYQRFGFEVTGEIVLPDGPTLWPMWRPE